MPFEHSEIISKRPRNKKAENVKLGTTAPPNSLQSKIIPVLKGV
jgi:hypothetical protein